MLRLGAGNYLILCPIYCDILSFHLPVRISVYVLWQELGSTCQPGRSKARWHPDSWWWMVKRWPLDHTGGSLLLKAKLHSLCKEWLVALLETSSHVIPFLIPASVICVTSVKTGVGRQGRWHRAQAAPERMEHAHASGPFQQARDSSAPHQVVVCKYSPPTPVLSSLQWGFQSGDSSCWCSVAFLKGWIVLQSFRAFSSRSGLHA